jgi:hypothetical protein
MIDIYRQGALDRNPGLQIVAYILLVATRLYQAHEN